MAQGGLMDARQVHDFYLFSITEVNPEDSSSLIARTLAWDMGRQVLGWVDPSHPAPRTLRGQTCSSPKHLGKR